MGRLFSFGNITNKLIFPFFLSFFCFGNYLSYTPLIKPNTFLQHVILYTFFEEFSYILCGILEILSCLIMKNVKKEKERIIKKKISITHISNLGGFDIEVRKEKKNIVYLHLVIIAVIHISCEVAIYGSSFTSVSSIYVDIFKILSVVASGAICLFVFDYKLFLHHYVSILLSLGSVIIITILSIIDQGFAFNIYNFLFYIAEIILYAIIEVYEKWMMLYKFISPFSLLFFEGLFGLGIKIIIVLILYFIPCKEGALLCVDNQIINFSDFFGIIGKNKFLILYIIIYILVTACLHVFRISTNKYYTPTHRVVADSLVLIYVYIYFLIYSQKITIWVCVVKICCYLILFFACLLYHEIIIANFCRLNYNTATAISRRSVQEIDGIIESQIGLGTESRQANEENQDDLLFIEKE